MAILEDKSSIQAYVQGWQTVRLSELCEQIADCPHSTPLWTDSGVVVLRNQNIRNGRLDLSSPSFTDDAHYEQRSRRARLKAGDLVLTREAPMGEVCIVPEGLRCCLGQRMVMLRPDPTKCDPRFLLYSIQSDAVQHEIKISEGTGSTVSNLRIPLLEALPIPHPPLQEQKAIAKVLSSLDDKIELNRRMNATLEAMARALFKAWFVDFEPVLANKANRPSTSASPEIAKLFPSEFENGIPKGWQRTTFGTVYKIFDSKRIPLSGKQRESKSGNYPYHGAASVMDYVDDYLFDGIYLLIGEDGSVTKSDGTPVIQYAWGKFWVNNHAHVLQGKGEISTEHLMLAVQDEIIVPYVTGAVQPKLNQGNLARIPFIKPTDIIENRFTESVTSLYSKIRQNTDENKCLAQIRDSLLPRLISGKLNVAEKEPKY